VAPDGTVQQSIPLPKELADQAGRFGFEGAAGDAGDQGLDLGQT